MHILISFIDLPISLIISSLILFFILLSPLSWFTTEDFKPSKSFRVLVLLYNLNFYISILSPFSKVLLHIIPEPTLHSFLPYCLFLSPKPPRKPAPTKIKIPFKSPRPLPTTIDSNPKNGYFHLFPAINPHRRNT
eukprot:TRINITY_DN4405_c0_g4_i1.p1 TRINITY_DN4405_c0_g4~~TRINITY_DN4405_c0_g4_i1.p1  ORF type:complete len:135 (-),score=10.57 TRINITY_DN4405_c0_g4_i1:171-575(-)